MRLVAAALALALLGGCAADALARIESPEGEKRLEVAVAHEARSAEERMRGLRGRSIAEDEGLLIVFPAEGEVCIVNEGVDYAVDVVYADAEGTVVSVQRGVAAGDATSRCRMPTARVLEVRAGVAATVVSGDRLVVE